MASFSKTLLTHQPTKGLWVLLAVLYNAVKLPFWLIWFLPPFMRPNSNWTFKQAVRVTILKTALWHMSLVEMKTPLSLTAGSEKDRWAVAEVTSEKHYTGIVKSDPKIKPEAIGGTWYNSSPKTAAEKGGLTVIHFHGGAFAIGDGRTRDAGFAAKLLLENTDAKHVFAPQYRLVTNPDGRFPAQLQDAITAYAYVTKKLGIASSNVVLSGDSAGGNLAIALTKYLTEHGKVVGLSQPAAVFAWSPWVNPSVGLDREALATTVNKDSDYITSEFGYWGASLYQPSKASGLDMSSPYIDFEHNTFATDVPIFVSSGECEVLLNQDARFADDMSKKHPSNNIRFHIQRHAVHDCILIGHMLGFEKVAANACKEANEWLQTVKK